MKILEIIYAVALLIAVSTVPLVLLISRPSKGSPSRKHRWLLVACKSLIQAAVEPKAKKRAAKALGPPKGKKPRRARRGSRRRLQKA